MTEAASPLETGELTPVEVRLDAMYKVGRDVAIVAERPGIDWSSKSKAVAAGARKTFLTGNTAGREVFDGYKEGYSVDSVEYAETRMVFNRAHEDLGLFEKIRNEIQNKAKDAPPFTAVGLSTEGGKQIIKVHAGRLREMGNVIGRWSEECADFNVRGGMTFRDIFGKKRIRKFQRLDPMFGEAAKFRKDLRDKGDSSGLLLFDTILSGYMLGMREISEQGKPIPLVQK